MHVTLTPFKAEDALEIVGRGADVYLDLLIRMEMDPGAVGWTGRLDDGRVLGCAGMTRPAAWIADFWVIPSSCVPDYPILFHKTVLAKFKELIETCGARRLQGVVDPRFPERERWIKRLGFVKECTMRAFGPHGEDMDLYSRIQEAGNGR